jgi:hypothetical protein
VLETVRLVLEQAAQPMRVQDVHAAAEQLAGKSLLRRSVKAALAAGASSRRPRFRRVRHGIYQLAGKQSIRSEEATRLSED